jgi:hypothetical protein
MEIRKMVINIYNSQGSSIQMINKQCDNCAKKGKNFYCNSCDITAEFFDIYSYYTNRTSDNSLIGRVKAYTWHDVLEYTRNNFFYGLSSGLKINCEKDFAYIEKKLSEQGTTNRRTVKADSEDPIGYKIYLNKDDKSIEDVPKVRNLWDLTLNPVTNNKYN